MMRDTDNLARVTSVRTEYEAGVIVGGLNSRGIQATMSGTYTTNFRAEAPGWVEVLVAEQDLAEAQAILEEVPRERGDVDWSQVDLGEPEDDPGSVVFSEWTHILGRAAVVLVLLGFAIQLCMSMVAN